MFQSYRQRAAFCPGPGKVPSRMFASQVVSHSIEGGKSTFLFLFIIILPSPSQEAYALGCPEKGGKQRWGKAAEKERQSIEKPALSIHCLPCLLRRQAEGGEARTTRFPHPILQPSLQKCLCVCVPSNEYACR